MGNTDIFGARGNQQMLRRPEIILGFLIATIFWIGVLGWTTSYSTIEQTKQTCSESAEKIGRDYAERKTFWERTTSDPIATFTLVLAVSTVGLWVATIGLYISGEKTAQRELRAYVFIGHANLVDFDDIPIIQIMFKNSGQTPAYNLRAWNAVRLAEFPLTQELTHPGEVEISRTALGPGMDLHITTPTARLTDIRRNAIRSGRAALYAFGRADYVDAFGRDRYLKWRLYYGGDAQRPDGSLAVHIEGNDAN